MFYLNWYNYGIIKEASSRVCTEERAGDFDVIGAQRPLSGASAQAALLGPCTAFAA
jgi:hypothetical protein